MTDDHCQSSRLFKFVQHRVVVRVPFPYTSRPIRQRRPALVVAAPKAAGTPDLPSPSIVRTAKIAVIDHAEAEPIGTVPPPDRLAVARALRALLGPAIAPA